MISSLRQNMAAFSIVGVLADANRFGKPDNNIATADAPSKPVRSRRREARLISRVSREKRRSVELSQFYGVWSPTLHRLAALDLRLT